MTALLHSSDPVNAPAESFAIFELAQGLVTLAHLR